MTSTSFADLHDAFQHIKDSGNKFPTVRCVYVWFATAHALPQPDKEQFGIALRKLREDAIGTLAEMGKALGFCMCCGQPLSNQESVDRGIGPDCWAKLQ